MEIKSHTILWLSSLRDWGVRGSQSAVVKGVHYHIQFYMVLGVRPGHPICSASPLPTELHSQPALFLLSRNVLGMFAMHHSS